jgi:hypothetical protein
LHLVGLRMRLGLRHHILHHQHHLLHLLHQDHLLLLTRLWVALTLSHLTHHLLHHCHLLLLRISRIRLNLVGLVNLLRGSSMDWLLPCIMGLDQRVHLSGLIAAVLVLLMHEILIFLLLDQSEEWVIALQFTDSSWLVTHFLLLLLSD